MPVNLSDYFEMNACLPRLLTGPHLHNILPFSTKNRLYCPLGYTLAGQTTHVTKWVRVVTYPCFPYIFK